MTAPLTRTGPGLNEFTLDAGSGILLPPGAGTPAGYLDGAEKLLLKALPQIRDRRTGSVELEPLMRGWAMTYHLTPYRATLFDALGFGRAGDARVLELGAGCGAITRWLGDHFGTVHAIEGSIDRARVARARTADLESVSIFSTNYSELAEESAYEAATLIGVLEYGHMYHPVHAGDPQASALANLRVAHRALVDDSVLVLAIENRLGLKYLNGAREDHSGRLFEGIEGYVDTRTPVTFSARELEDLVLGAGFDSAQFLLPFPDYKLARTMVNPDRVEDGHHIEDWLAGAAPDRGSARGPLLYNETLAIAEIARAGLLRDLSNSFLVLAYKGDREAANERLGIDVDWSARHYSLDRRAGLRKRATLRGDVVEHEPAPYGDADLHGVRKAIARFGIQHTPLIETHQRGRLLLNPVLRSVMRDGFGSELVAHVVEHREWLLRNFGADAPELVRGEAFDVSWWNIVIDDATGEWRVIDTEWAFTRPLPADFVVWRNLAHFILRHRAEFPRKLRDASIETVVIDVLKRAGVELSHEAHAAFIALDRELGAAVVPGPLPLGPSSTLDAAIAAVTPARRPTVLALADEVIAKPELLTAYAGAVTADDPVTLVLYAPDADAEAVGPAVEAALAAAGMAGEALDVILLAVPRDAATEAALCDGTIAVLTEAQPRAFRSLPRVGRRDGSRLRELLDAVDAPPAGTLPAGVAALADALATQQGAGRVVAVKAPVARGEARWLSVDPDTVPGDALLEALAGAVAVAEVEADRLRSDHCLRTVLQVAADAAAAIVLCGADEASLTDALAVLELQATLTQQIDGREVAVVDPAAAAQSEPAGPFNALAFADEVVADPAVLETWANAFAGTDAASLVIYAPGCDEQAAYDALAAPVAAAGLEGDDSAEIVVIAVPAAADGEVRLAGMASALLSGRRDDGVFGLLERIAPGDAPALRAAAERTWAGAAAPRPTRRHELAICAIVREEGPYLREWLEFHRLTGVEHFYIYDNGSTDETRAVLAPYVDAGLVTVIEFPHAAAQLPAYNHCVRTFGAEAAWIAFMDADEFLFNPGGGDLRATLREFEGYGGVHVNWANYGTAGHQTQPEGPVIGAYTKRARDDAAVPYRHLLKSPDLDPEDPASYHALNAHVKSIVRPDRVEECLSPHHWRYSDGWFGVTEDHERHAGPVTGRVSRSKLRINHYWTKSVDECRRKFERGRASVNQQRVWPDEFLMRDAVLNDVDDDAILVHLEALNAALESEIAPQPAAPEVEPLVPRMTAAELALLRAVGADRRFVLEFGCGGSTADWLRQGVGRVVSVESDPKWAGRVTEHPDLVADAASGRLKVVHADVGPTGAWGLPEGRAHIDRWPGYWSGVWGSPVVADAGEPVDLVFVDGRFRVACALNAALHVQPDVPIVIHDFFDREHYHAVLAHLEVVERADTLVVLRRRADFDPARAVDDLARHALDPR